MLSPSFLSLKLVSRGGNMQRNQSQTDDVYAVILAGGSGTRFWPKSRHLKPKQLCKIGGQAETMIEVTLSRLEGLIPPERRMIVTHQDQMVLTKKIVGSKAGIFLAEPEAKNTANALAIAALEIERIHQGKPGKPVMISLHADHVIKDVAGFRGLLGKGVDVAKSGFLTLLGVFPEYPETGYGYIEQGQELKEVQGSYRVKSFREKPEYATAKSYVESGRFFWNAGLFVWEVDLILTELTKALQPTIEKLRQLRDKAGSFTTVAAKDFRDVYHSLPKISIDHAVLEVSEHVAVIPAAMGWQDVGSWDAIARGFAPDGQGNNLLGDTFVLDTTGTTIDTDGPFVAAIGVTDQVIVAASGAILVCPKSRAQDVKKVVEWLEAKGRRELI